jgi:acyl-CoA synthetase (AMP-forming)/AMP-acid ligase II
VHAVVVERAPVDDSDLVAFARARLASYKVPRTLSRIDEIPRTASGKTLKRELRAVYGDSRSA